LAIYLVEDILFKGILTVADLSAQLPSGMDDGAAMGLYINREHLALWRPADNVYVSDQGETPTVLNLPARVLERVELTTNGFLCLGPLVGSIGFLPCITPYCNEGHDRGSADGVNINGRNGKVEGADDQERPKRDCSEEQSDGFGPSLSSKLADVLAWPMMVWHGLSRIELELSLS
jgi:hypothetical protein